MFSTGSSAPSVSVIIPFYSNVEWLLEAMASLEKQTCLDWEAIIVNDGSPEDDSKVVERTLKDKRYVYIRQQNAGAGAARNHGIGISKGRYVAFLDSDDLWAENKLEKQKRFMDETGLVWSHTAYSTFVDGSQDYMLVDNSSCAGNMYPSIFLSAPIATPCVMVRGEVLRADSSLRFNRSMRYGQDTYLWVLLAKKYELGYVADPLTMVRMRGTNAKRKAFAHLTTRGHLASLLPESNHDSVLPAYVYFAYGFAKWGSARVLKMQEAGKSSAKVEMLSKLLYFVPYALFRVARKRS